MSIRRRGEPSPWNIIQEWSVMIIGEHEDAFDFDFDEVLLWSVLMVGLNEYNELAQGLALLSLVEKLQMLQMHVMI